MLLTPLPSDESMKELPFQHLISKNQQQQMTYLIKDRKRVLGFVELEWEDETICKLTKFVVTKLDHTERLIEIFYHILEKFERTEAEHLIVETEEEPLTELLIWLGFKQWSDEKNILGYTYS